MNKLITKLVENKKFETVTGLIFFLNPIVIFLQLYKAFFANNVEAISTPTWFLFIIMQITATLVAFKAKNKGMLYSYILSIIFSILLVFVVIVKS